ncbi:MAG: type II secretion system protein [Actinomycetes bacterium]
MSDIKRAELDKGLTLIELLVVLIIIGILASVAYVSLGSTRTNAFQNACKTAYQAEALAISSYQSDNSGTLPPSLTALMPTYISSGLVASYQSNFSLQAGFFGVLPTNVDTITNVARTGTLVTITTAVAHGFIAGDTVAVTATTNSSVNGTYTVVSGSGTTFTYNDVTSGTIAAVADTGSAIVYYVTYSAGTVSVKFAVPAGYPDPLGANSTVLSNANTIQIAGVDSQNIDGTYTSPTFTAVTAVTSSTAGVYKVTFSKAATITGVSGNGATITFTASNSFVVGQSVTITGVNPVAYNVTGTITTASSTQFTIAGATNSAYVSGGSAGVTIPSISTPSSGAILNVVSNTANSYDVYLYDSTGKRVTSGSALTAPNACSYLTS